MIRIAQMGWLACLVKAEGNYLTKLEIVEICQMIIVILFDVCVVFAHISQLLIHYIELTAVLMSVRIQSP